MMGKIHASTILFLAVCLFSARGQEKNSPSSIDSVYAPVCVSSAPSDAYNIQYRHDNQVLLFLS